MECLICKDKIDIPTKLKCSHQFCYLCITRHLSNSHFCPQCYQPAIYCDIDVETEKNDLKAIRPILRYTKANLKQELKKYKLDSSGGLYEQEMRYKEFYLIYDTERRRKVPKSVDCIARQVNLMAKRNKTAENFVNNGIYKTLKKLKQRMEEDRKLIK